MKRAAPKVVVDLAVDENCSQEDGTQCAPDKSRALDEEHVDGLGRSKRQVP